jgi:hypothetical protein
MPVLWSGGKGLLRLLRAKPYLRLCTAFDRVTAAFVNNLAMMQAYVTMPEPVAVAASHYI